MAQIKVKGGRGWLFESRAHERICQPKSSNRHGCISVGGFKTKFKFTDTASSFYNNAFFSKLWSSKLEGIKWDLPMAWINRWDFVGKDIYETRGFKRKPLNRFHTGHNVERICSLKHRQKDSRSEESSHHRQFTSRQSPIKKRVCDRIKWLEGSFLLK